MIIRKTKQNIALIIAFGLIFFGLASEFYAQNSGTSETVRKINIKFEDFRYNLNANLNRESFNREDENEINGYMNELEDSIVNFEEKFQKQVEKPDDVSLIINSTENVSRFVAKSKLDAKVQNSWRDFRGLVESLSNNYSVTTNEISTPDPRISSKYFDNGLNGTYKLDVSRSDNAREIITEATQNSPQFEKDAALRHFDEKLDSPQVIAIDNNGNSVSIASSKSPRVSFDTNGREKIQKTNDGRNIRIRSEIKDDELTISAEQEAQKSNRLRDYSYVVTFSAMDNGQSLRVIRRLTDDEINQTFIVTSFYEKTSEVANLDIYDTPNSFPTNRNPRNPPANSKGRRGDYAVSDGAILTGTLQDNVSTKVSQNGDRFRIRIESPNEYRGAIVEGSISGINRSGKISGNSKLTFNFEKILLTNGQTYDFAGFLQSITDTNGKTVKVDEEGTIKGKSQTKESIKRGGIGAGAGAIIGAIIGGAKGAIIGATIGGGAGAGSVIVTGKEDIDLTEGSSITIQASSPVK